MFVVSLEVLAMGYVRMVVLLLLNVSDVRSVLEGVLVCSIYQKIMTRIILEYADSQRTRRRLSRLRLRMLVRNGDLYPGLV